MRSPRASVASAIVLLVLAAILFSAAPASAGVDMPTGVPDRYAHEFRASRSADRVTTHKVRANESLSSIAADYDVPEGWTRLAWVNRDKLGPDYNVIERGIVLTIPDTPGKQVTWTPPPVPSSVDTSGGSSNTSGGYVDSSGVWHDLAQCESTMTNADTGNGYFGYFQFTVSSWHAAGGSGHPLDASYAEQQKRAEILQGMQGWSTAFPGCAAKLGLD